MRSDLTPPTTSLPHFMTNKSYNFLLLTHLKIFQINYNIEENQLKSTVYKTPLTFMSPGKVLVPFLTVTSCYTTRLTCSYSNFPDNFCQSPPITALLLGECRAVSPD